MTDTDTTITIEPHSSPFDRLPPDLGDPDLDDLDRLAASLHHLALRCREPSSHEPSKHPVAEAMAKHEDLLIGAVPTAGEQL